MLKFAARPLVAVAGTGSACGDACEAIAGTVADAAILAVFVLIVVVFVAAGGGGSERSGFLDGTGMAITVAANSPSLGSVASHTKHCIVGGLIFRRDTLIGSIVKPEGGGAGEL